MLVKMSLAESPHACILIRHSEEGEGNAKEWGVQDQLNTRVKRYVLVKQNFSLISADLRNQKPSKRNWRKHQKFSRRKQGAQKKRQ